MFLTNYFRRSQKKRAKKQRAQELERLKTQVSLSVQTEEVGEETCDELEAARLSLKHYQTQTDRLSQLCGSEAELVETVQRIVQQAAERETEVGRLREENRRIAEDVAVQLRERDKAHSERVRSLEILMTEKEKQLLQNTNSIRQQLASAKQEAQHLHKQVEVAETKRRRFEEGSLEQELESMLVVLDMKKEENDQLKACNNTLRLDLERITGVDIQLQVERQKTEEMSSVIKLKNDQLRQLLDEYDNVQHQLDIEVFHLVDGPSNVGPFLVLTSFQIWIIVIIINYEFWYLNLKHWAGRCYVVGNFQICPNGFQLLIYTNIESLIVTMKDSYQFVQMKN